MGKKYIIELDEDPHNIRLMQLKNGGNGVPVTEFKVVCPYKEHDLEQVRKEAYDNGYEDAEEKYNDGYSDGYDAGLIDAWEAARKISMAEINGRCSWKSMKNIFGIEIPSKIFKNFTASEVIEKLKACEQEQGAEIKVGNEVKAFEKKPFIVTGFGYGYDEKDVYCHGFVTENGISTSAKKNSCVRTGRHFPEIAAAIEKMRGEKE